MEKIGISIRPSKEDDFAELVYIDNKIWNHLNAPIPIHWDNIEDYAKSNPAGSQYVALFERNVAGYISFKAPTPLLSNSHVMEIAIGVHPNYQGKGIGKSLINYIIGYAAKTHINKISLRVLATNTSAIEFYKSLEFMEQGRLVKEFYINGNFVDDILMYRNITP